MNVCVRFCACKLEARSCNPWELQHAAAGGVLALRGRKRFSCVNEMWMPCTLAPHDQNSLFQNKCPRNSTRDMNPTPHQYGSNRVVCGCQRRGCTRLRYRRALHCCARTVLRSSLSERTVKTSSSWCATGAWQDSPRQRLTSRPALQGSAHPVARHCSSP